MDTLIKCLSELNIGISNDQIELFDRYYELLIFWNNKFNLTYPCVFKILYSDIKVDEPLPEEVFTDFLPKQN